MAGLTDEQYPRLAIEFASALVAGDIARAYAMTSPSYHAGTSLTDMRKSFEEMVEPIQPLGETHLMNTMVDWPTKMDEDVGWAHVAIDGTGWSEAVSVIVSREDGVLCIRDVEWGRP